MNTPAEDIAAAVGLSVAELNQRLLDSGKQPLELTPRQKQEALPIQEMPKCAGLPAKPCKVVDAVMISGFDEQPRCGACNKIHVELVYRESGNTAPNSSKPGVVADVNRAVGDENRRRKILEEFGPRDGWSSPPLITEAPGDHRDIKSFLDKDQKPTSGKSDEERRQDILEKYGRRR